MLLGVLSPIGSISVNLLGQNLFSQISQVKNLSELNPTEALGNVTIPFDKILKVVGQKVNISSPEDIKKIQTGKKRRKPLETGSSCYLQQLSLPRYCCKKENGN